jgi:anion-transporting  ArsA/GET3 family ATPase
VAFVALFLPYLVMLTLLIFFRLLNDLTLEAPDMPIKVRNIVVNQVLKDDGSDIETFVSHISDGQESAISDLTEAMQGMVSPPGISKIPYLDVEPREVYALKSFGDLLVSEGRASVEL